MIEYIGDTLDGRAVIIVPQELLEKLKTDRSDPWDIVYDLKVDRTRQRIAREWEASEVYRKLSAVKGMRVSSLARLFRVQRERELGYPKDRWTVYRFENVLDDFPRFDGTIESYRAIADRITEVYDIGPALAAKYNAILLGKVTP